ncbi:hypothetical protein F5148DRAFT_176881, partial [Russula earlei]
RVHTRWYWLPTTDVHFCQFPVLCSYLDELPRRSKITMRVSSAFAVFCLAVHVAPSLAIPSIKSERDYGPRHTTSEGGSSFMGKWRNMDPDKKMAIKFGAGGAALLGAMAAASVFIKNRKRDEVFDKRNTRDSWPYPLPEAEKCLTRPRIPGRPREACG